jgi:hypothetical protein
LDYNPFNPSSKFVAEVKQYFGEDRATFILGLIQEAFSNQEDFLDGRAVADFFYNIFYVENGLVPQNLVCIQ